jgi:hypothetical protein
MYQLLGLPKVKPVRLTAKGVKHIGNAISVVPILCR